MELTVTYDHKADVLFIGTGKKHVFGDSLECDMDIIVEYGSERGYDIAAITVMFASDMLSPYFALVRREAPLPEITDNPIASYDKETDTLTLGVVTDDPAMTAQAGEYITGYWQRDADDEDYFNIIGVALRQASKHLEPFFRPAGAVAGGQLPVAGDY